MQPLIKLMQEDNEEKCKMKKDETNRKNFTNIDLPGQPEPPRSNFKKEK